MSYSHWSLDLRPSALLHGANLKYYVAFAIAGFIIWCFRGDRRKAVDVPEFDAGKLRWMFQADKLARESYENVPSVPVPKSVPDQTLTQ